jgi:hypothetical protein
MHRRKLLEKQPHRCFDRSDGPSKAVCSCSCKIIFKVGGPCALFAVHLFLFLSFPSFFPFPFFLPLFLQHPFPRSYSLLLLPTAFPSAGSPYAQYSHFITTIFTSPTPFLFTRFPHSSVFQCLSNNTVMHEFPHAWSSPIGSPCTGVITPFFAPFRPEDLNEPSPSPFRSSFLSIPKTPTFIFFSILFRHGLPRSPRVPSTRARRFVSGG